MREVIKMEIPDYVCQAICAGLDIEAIIGDEAMIEPPELRPVNNDPQLNNPHMNTEEGLHSNTFRYGKDDRVPEKVAESPFNGGEKYGGGYECSSAVPKVDICLEKGGELSHWISERLVNKEHFCDYEKGSCVTLFAE
jgi:hypothetical protein